MRKIKNESINILILLAPIVYFFVVKNNLPSVESYKFSFIEPYKVYNQFLMTYAGTIIIYIVILLKGSFRHKGFDILKTFIVLFGITVAMIFIAVETKIEIDILKIIWVLSGLFIIIYGNFFPVVKFKSIFGIRNRWTKSNSEIWSLTHKITGRIWFLSGLIILTIALILETSNTEFVYSILTFCLIFIPHLLSYIIYMSKRKV
jgi:uncharacterized membrane protein